MQGGLEFQSTSNQGVNFYYLEPNKKKAWAGPYAFFIVPAFCIADTTKRSKLERIYV